MNTVKKIDRCHILIHASYQALAGIVYGFGVFMLVRRGYNSQEAGICLSLANGASFLIQPVVSNFLDKSKKVTVFEMCILVSSFVATLFLVNAIIPSKSLLLTLSFVIGTGLFSSLEPLLNSFSNIFITNGLDIQFSTARAIGSTSYGIVCAVFGVISNNYPLIYVVLGGFAFALILTFASFSLRLNFKKTNIDILGKKDEIITFVEFVKTRKMFVVLCIFLTGLFLGYTCVDNFTLLIVEQVGGSSADMGIILCIKASLEAIVIFNFQKILEKVKLKKILVFGAFAFVGKNLVEYFATNITTIYIAQAFQMISFALILPGMVEFVYRNMNKGEAIRGQALVTMTIGLGSIISSSIGGTIANSLGISAMMLFACVITFISAVGFSYFIYKQ